MKKLRDVEDLLKVAKALAAWIKGEKADTLRIDCMNELGIYTSTINVESTFSKWVKKIGPKSKEFPLSQVYDVKMYGLKPIPKKIENATVQQGDRIVVDLTKGLKYDMFRLEVSYRMEQEWLGALVHSRSSPEPLEEALRYNLSAQLTDPSSLAKGFREVDIEEFPVTADVQIQESINATVPVLKKMAEIEAEILSDYDPHHGVKILALQKERHRLKTKLGKGDPTRKLRELMVFLRPTKFMTYVAVQPDFRFHYCEWGSDVFRTLGMLALPKKMEVISRTDLDLDRPASKGSMMFESGKFSTDVSEIFKKKK
jgi:hypothetical protein